MGADAGFDMVPRLSQGVKDRMKWERFLEVVKQHYAGDGQVEVGSRVIYFKAGEWPSLPIEGHKFLRFSSKITGRIAAETGVENYIREVMSMAKAFFGGQIRPWTELCDEFGFYRWDFVHASIKSYESEVPTPEPIPITSVNNQGTDCDTNLYKVMTIPGRGRGLVATVDIPKGTRILCEKPLLKVESSMPEFVNRCVAEKLKLLSKDKQGGFLSLHNNFPGPYAFAGVVRTNALPCGPGSSVGGIYLTACFINHSCIPNAHNNWNEAAQYETIHATRDILVGEEILISYAAEGSSQTRQQRLRESFGFQCSCELCSQSPQVIQASDKRRADIQRLDETIGDPVAMMNSPQKSLAACHNLLQILDKEYAGAVIALLARLYYDAFQISVAHGDQARASVFAERSYMSRVECEGEDSPATQWVKSLMQNPTKHSTFNAYSTKWRTSKTARPRNLDADSFDKWLWRLSA
ncbi:hypothetical protein F5B22DRAFT_635548 [Xylaria bambusicola]|uniref:uncharacterized protein n=1 Tax=Xylaria bambusicola TaxID=326684 RepID=UPI002007BB1D|nr:uncharacterized protein F5B22DRAFT_635548 [Xylaria bambusicola]KAI0518067.1 hypothetical protein F5B22DRAFT_635548 [Xylaria bambusicola]